MSYLETKYLNLLSTHLRNFKRKSSNLWNFSCPFCGDSAKNTRKARGYVYAKGDKLLFTCHNCSLTTSVPKLIGHVSPYLHDEYIKEMLMEKYQPKMDADSFTKKVIKDVPLLGFLDLTVISMLPNGHPAKEYLKKRQIPEKWFDRLYHAPEFMKWTNFMVPDKFSKEALEHDEPRIVVPFLTKDKKVFGFQGRRYKGVDNDGHKYYTIILREDQPKFFGMDRVDMSRRFYVFEGPFDAMFIPNSVAITGGNLDAIENLNSVLVFDNEPRHLDTLKRMKKAINKGYNVVIWPSNVREKDVNEMVLAGVNAEFIKTMIDNNTWNGMSAQLVFEEWKKR